MILRWIIGLPVAALITLFIYMGMSGMIRMPTEFSEAEERETIVITRQISEPRVDPPPPKPDPLPKDTPPPPIVTQDKLDDGPPKVTDSRPPSPKDGDGVKPEPQPFPTPNIRIAPPYPDRCASKGAEGTVIVEFDVSPQGEVINPRIIASPDSCFDRTVLKAVSGWKYSPGYVDGVPIARRNIREVFQFELE